MRGTLLQPSAADVYLQEPVEWAHPLAVGLVSWWLPLPQWSGSNTLFDLCKRFDGTLTNGPTWAAGPNGSGFGALNFDGTNDYASAGSISGLATWTLTAWVRDDAGGTGPYSVMGQCNSSLTSCTFYWRYGSSTTLGFTTGGSYRELSLARPTFGVWTHCVVVYTGAALVHYQNGHVVNTSGALSGTPDNPGTPVTIGRPGDFNGQYWAGRLSDLSVRSRALAAVEVAALYDESRRGFPTLLRRVRSWSFGVAAGGTNYTLTADAGAYTVTGSTATLTAARTLSAGAGSYTTTGADASLTVSRTLSAGAGSYTVTGADASPTVARSLSAGAGAYTVTGSTANPLAARSLSAGAGSYSVTGSNAALLAGRTLSAGAGSYTTTGADATPLANRSLSSGAGAYTVTGNDATLIAAGDKTLAANGGSYSLTGGAAALLVSRQLTADTGAYSYSGAAAAPLAARVLVGASASYAVAGADAILNYSGAPSARPGGVFRRAPAESGRVFGAPVHTVSRAFRRAPGESGRVWRYTP